MQLLDNKHTFKKQGSAASAVPRPPADSIFDPDIQNGEDVHRGGARRRCVYERARVVFGISEKNALAQTRPAAPQRPGQTERVIRLDMLEADRRVRPIVLAQASGAIE
jgi:hypothetical protein